jgi:DNA polymerase III epsilon subunit-like protein
MKKMVVDEDLSQTTFVVLDLETSGASPKTGSAITEIGAVKVCGGQVLGTFKTFVNPGTPLPPFITELTGITDEMLIDAPRIESVLPLLFEFLVSQLFLWLTTRHSISLFSKRQQRYMDTRGQTFVSSTP